MSSKEIRILRNKFIRIAMTSFLMVILFVGLLINIVTYVVTQREVKWSLEQLARQQAAVEEAYDEMYPFPDMPSFIEVFSPSFQHNTFYILSYDREGDESAIYTSRANSYSETVIRENAAEIMDKKASEGRHGMFYYRKTVDEEGFTTLVIMDSSYVIFMRMRLLYASIAVGAVSVLTALLLVIRLSGRMILPEIENSRRQLQFLTNVSHELKTPLAVIRSNAEIEELKKGESEWMQSTIRQVDRMSGLIKNLVMITKTRETEDSSPATEVNFSRIVSQTAKEYSAMAESTEKTLLQRIEEGIEKPLDESRLRQLIVILLDNAVKYCDTGGEITVTLKRLKKGKNHVRLIISNTYAEGDHIDYTRFFDRFYREDTSHNIDTGGYGIGLSIAQSLCVQLGGGISVQWKDGVISFICDIC